MRETEVPATHILQDRGLQSEGRPDEVEDGGMDLEQRGQAGQ